MAYGIRINAYCDECGKKTWAVGNLVWMKFTDENNESIKGFDSFEIFEIEPGWQVKEVENEMEPEIYCPECKI